MHSCSQVPNPRTFWWRMETHWKTSKTIHVLVVWIVVHLPGLGSLWCWMVLLFPSTLCPPLHNRGFQCTGWQGKVLRASDRRTHIQSHQYFVFVLLTLHLPSRNKKNSILVVMQPHHYCFFLVCFVVVVAACMRCFFFLYYYYYYYYYNYFLKL